MPVPISNLTSTFSDPGYRYVGFGLNVTYTGAEAGSRLFEIKVNNDPKFWIDLSGTPSSNISASDLIARNLTNTATVATNNYTNSAIAVANNYLSSRIASVGIGANSYTNSAIVLTTEVNALAQLAFTRANTPNVYIANTNGVSTVVHSSERKIINFIDTPANTGVGVRITDNVAIGASDIQLFSYDMLANNVSLNGLSGVSIDNTILPRRYKIITFHFDEVSFSTTATLRIAISIDNGSNFNFFNISASQLAANTVSGITNINVPYGSGSSTRKILNTFTSGFDGTNLNFTNSMYSSGTLTYGAPINWINFYPSTGTFDGGVLTILGYY